MACSVKERSISNNEDTNGDLCSLLSNDSEGLSASTGGLGSLTSDLLSPEVSETSVVLGLSHSLEILSESGIHQVGDELGIGSISGVLLSVEEPLGDVVVGGSSDDVVHGVDFLLSDLSASLVEVDLGDLEGEDGESSSNTSDLSQTEGSLLFTVDVSVLDSQNMSKVIWVLQNQ